ncbi:peptidylprolyl isomerase [Patescibacteria group bacterium]
MKKFLASLAVLSIIFTFTACTSNITKSKNYETHNLKYLVNLTHAEGDKTLLVEDLKASLTNRLNKFEVAQVEITEVDEGDLKYLLVKFGTIDDVVEIKKRLSQNSTFSIKKKITDESDYETELKEKAQNNLDSILGGENFELAAQNEVLEDPERVFYSISDWMYKDEIKDVFADVLFDLEQNQVHSSLIEYNERPFALANPIKIASIAKLFDKEDVEQTISHTKSVTVSHILISYKGVAGMSESISRTKEEAETLANEILDRLNNGENFSKLALDYSDDSTNSSTGGALVGPAGEGKYVEQFENAALALNEVDELSSVTESPFGFHIIQAREVAQAYEETNETMQAKFGVIFYALRPVEWALTDLEGEFITSVDIIFDNEYDPFLVLKLNDEGRRLLKELSGTNGDILGIFSGDELITSFTVKEILENGEFKILSPNNTEEADNIQEKLLLKPLPVPIIFIEELA